MEIEIKRGRGRPATLTEEERKLRIKKYNDNRGPQKCITRICPICEIGVRSQNYNRHFTSETHAKNVIIKELKSKLEQTTVV